MYDGIANTISPRTVRQILKEVDLQTHRTCYWKTSHLNDAFKRQVEKVLWCYANAERLATLGIWVVCVDEIPGFQVLGRKPLRRAIPGHPEQVEFEYVRHCTISITL